MLGLLTNSTAASGNSVAVVRQLMGAMQRASVTYGNLAFNGVDVNRIGFRVSWPNNITDVVVHVSGSYLAHGTVTRIALDFSSVIHIPNVHNSSTVYVTKLESDNIATHVTGNVVSSSATSFETYLQWSLTEAERHYGTLQMEFNAPNALGELQITGFYKD